MMAVRTLSARGRSTPVPATSAAVAVLTVLLHLPVSAQQPPSVPTSGTRVRITVPCASQGGDCRLQGSVLRVGSDTITLAASGATVSQPLSTVIRAEVSRGRRSYWLVGGAIGLVAGAGVTYAVLNTGGSTALCNRSENQDAISSGECLGLTALGGAGGFGLGALVGWLIKTERWESVPLERLRVGLWAPTGSNAGLAVGFEF